MSRTCNVSPFASGGRFVLAVAAASWIGVPAPALAADEITFTKDVAPILQRSCQTCHRPGSIAPMSLLTYEEARPWARAIKQKVVARSMPPWFIDKNVGIRKFKGDRSLTDQEIATLVKWVDGGAQRGDPAAMPPPIKFDDQRYDWTLKKALGREPDIVVPIPKPFVVKAGSPNLFMEFVSDTGLKEDRYIKAMETKPSLEGFTVVHHATTSLFLPNAPPEEQDTAGFLSEYALGKTGDIFPDGTGRLMAAGAKLMWNLHYAANSNGKDTTDRTSIAFWLYPKGYAPTHKVVTRQVGRVTDLDIPPGEDNVRTDGYTVLEDNIRLTIYQPHLHNLGKRQCLEAIYKDGRVQTLNCVDWDFGWHIAYNYEEDVQPLLPKGTILHLTSWHNNTSSNKWAKDPRNWVGWGNRTTDDMAHAHVSWYALTDKEFEEHAKARRALIKTHDQEQRIEEDR